MSLFDIDNAIAEFMASDKTTMHIVPKHGTEHESNVCCWCVPDIEEFGGTLIVIHHTEH